MKSLRMLIVDNQPDHVALLRQLFPEYEVNEAGNGRQALKMVSEEKPDVIILDGAIPGLDGSSVLSIIKNSVKTHNVAVVLIAGAQDPEARAMAADATFSQQFHPLELRAKVAELMRVKMLQDELEDVKRMLVSLVRLMEDKTEFFRGHSQRTGDYAVRLARKNLLGPAAQEEIRLAALLHDIGNIYIRDSVLLSPGNLAEAEVDSLKVHPIIGEKICSSLTSLRPVLKMIRHHHERYDGSGYPDGLKGEEIPLGARLLAVADAYVAMISPRPYRPAKAAAEGLAVLREGAGTCWDPRLVELFCQAAEGEG